ncbi:hypothetical protein EG327_004151 [Venturia inaequalis]|uniref:peptidylprolyl isomerase n=1 Tax=Venturia inaequalis TaxID=5025 RepID=A0A8H3VT33_VENIN|nr:hypothetical protein EG327_004151 [Venturia inaequalis]
MLTTVTGIALLSSPSLAHGFVQRLIAMERYTVSVLPLESTRFLIPFRTASTVFEFKTEIARRLQKQGTAVDAPSIQLYLGNKNGPLLDDEDLLANVVLDPSKEEVFATIPSDRSGSTASITVTSQAVAQLFQLKISSCEPLEANESGFRIRVITPRLAKQQKDLSAVSLLPGLFSRTTTLRTIRTRVAQQLGLDNDKALEETNCDDQECNCSFAKSLVNNTHFKIKSREDAQAVTGTPFIVTHSKGVVEQMCAQGSVDQSSLFSQISNTLEAKFGSQWSSFRRMELFNENRRVGSFMTNFVPIVAVCSKSRHVVLQPAVAGNVDISRTDAQSNELADNDARQFTVDLHTAEAPIAATRFDLTICQLGLEDTIVNGVLNLFAVVRQVSTDKTVRPKGKDGIYLAGPSWELPVKQSERGTAMFLASLRVFCHFFGSSMVDDRLRDSILHVFHVLSDFPPAVRTLHILLTDKTPSLSECAAFVQACYETVREMVPLRLIGSNNGRIFEGARLFFGYIAEKSKAFKLPAEDGNLLPYLGALKMVHLCQSETMEPIAFPVDSNLGLLEQGCFDALSSGVIEFTEAGLGPVSALPLDGRTKRAALLSGGHCTEVLMFDIDILYANDKYTATGKMSGQSQIIDSAEMQDVNYLSVLCSRNELTVVSPRRLASASAPSLTLDRDGLGAVYVGRQPCGNPGRDFLIFRPTRGGEMTVDPAIVAQLLSPIMALREADGSAILDAIGDPAEQKLEIPDEILMICVDCSASMEDRTGFHDVAIEDEGSEAASISSKYGLVKTLAEISDLESNPTAISTPLEETKEELVAHDSFENIVQTIGHTLYHLQESIASELLVLLINVMVKGVRSQQVLVDSANRRAWALGSAQIDGFQSRLADLKKTLIGLIRHKDALADFLVFRARSVTGLPTSWYWNIGDDVPPATQAQQGDPRVSTALKLRIPAEYCCPISEDLFDDPVTTADGQHYDRAAITRWFQIRKSSPCTGLPLANTNLSTDRRMVKDVREWINGEDLVHNEQEQPLEKKHQKVQPVVITFQGRQGMFNRTVSCDIATSVLYDLAFRALKGRYTDFNLSLASEVILPANASTIGSFGITGNILVKISLPGPSLGVSGATEVNSSTNNDDLCLVKIYDDPSRQLFGVWLPKSTELTFSDLMFSYWRFMWRECSKHPKKLVTPWTGLSDMGDGKYRGRPLSLLDKISPYLTPIHAIGKLGKETIYQSSSRSNSSEPLVFKFMFRAERWKSSRRKTQLSRLDALKQMFDQLLNRIIAYGYRTHLGLITINSLAHPVQRITHVVEDFRATVTRLTAHGDTALWDSLELAKDRIVEYAAKYPQARKRILCISDGMDTRSIRSPFQVYPDLVRNGIVVDSFCLGEVDNLSLRTVSFLTDGFKFAPKTLEQAMMICELEPVLSQLERDTAAIVSKRNACRLAGSSNPASRFYSATGYADAEPLSKDLFPNRKEHPHLQDSFVELVPSSRRGFGPATRVGSNLRSSRLLGEIQSIAANPHPHMDVYVSEQDMSFWKIVMQGPPDSIYGSGTFVLYLHMEENYPTFAPKCRFVTSIYHPNVNKHGRICHSIFDRNWTSDTTTYMVLSTVYGLLLVPDYSDPVNVVVTLDFHHDQVAFAELAREHITKHATESRTEHRSAILGGK